MLRYNAAASRSVDGSRVDGSADGVEDLGGGGSLVPKSGVNIMAELAPSQGHRKNLLSPTPTPTPTPTPGHASDPAGATGNRRPLEVIVYPSGQLLKGPDPGRPASSTIGPALESALLHHYYRDQLPHYVLAKSRRRMRLEVRTSLGTLFFCPTGLANLRFKGEKKW